MFIEEIRKIKVGFTSKETEYINKLIFNTDGEFSLGGLDSFDEVIEQFEHHGSLDNPICVNILENLKRVQLYQPYEIHYIHYYIKSEEELSEYI